MAKKTVIQNTLTYDLKEYSDYVINKTKELIQQLIFKTENEATRSAPQFISIASNFEDKGLKAEVGVIGAQSVPSNQSDVANMAAYIEFGTGLSAVEILSSYPQWVKDIAYEYYVSGDGTLKGKPYLFNNFLKNHEVFERDLNKLLEKEFKK